MQKLLSIAVPAYNAERYLDKCIASMLVEDVLGLLEIIIVDDGSTDSTGAIADRYAAQHPDSIFVIHKENGGHGSGINVAVEIACGKYFRVVDADDWLLSENLPAHLRELEHCDADVVISGFHRVDMKSGKRILIEAPVELKGQIVSAEDLIPYLLSVKNCFSIQGITYLRNTYLSFGWKLSEMVFFEDSEYICLPVYAAKFIFFSKLPLYQYMIGNTEQSISNANQVKRLGDLQQVFMRICESDHYKQALSEFQKQYFNEKLRGMLTTYLVTCLLRFPNRAEGKDKANELLHWVLQNCPSLLAIAQREYRKISLLAAFHVNGELFDMILESWLYRMVKTQLRKP